MAYIPDGKVIGLSKIARVVEVISRRPQVQERMTEDIANLLVEELGAKGVAVVIEASHSCMTIRGVKKPGSSMVTSAMKGVFRSNLSSRAEVMQLIYGKAAVRRSRAPRRQSCSRTCLVEFLFRLTFGVATAMALTPAKWVTSGFFRVHLWVLLGRADAGGIGGLSAVRLASAAGSGSGKACNSGWRWWPRWCSYVGAVHLDV